MEKPDIERVRAFNRAVTRRVGALGDSYLGRGRPLGQARLLFEIGPGGRGLNDLRASLGLDSGYLSRLLSTLAEEGLARVEGDPADGRRRVARLTKKGQVEWTAYDRLSEKFARSMLSPLGAGQRRRLVAAMETVERLLAAGEVEIADAPADGAEARACLQAYFAELERRFEGGFDPSAGTGVAGSPPLAFLLARLEARAVGCGALLDLGSGTAEIKRMWVSPAARRLGIARRLLEALEQRAREAGVVRVVLDTNRTLSEARSLYETAGYRAIARYNENPHADFWFEKLLR